MQVSWAVPQGLCKVSPLSLRAAQRRSNLHTAIGNCFVAKTAPRNDKRRRGFVKRLCTHPGGASVCVELSAGG